MNTSELISLIDGLYPNATSNTDKILYMNIAQNSLSKDFGLLVEDDTLKTIIAQDYYAFPTGITDISEIISIGIGNSATPTSRYDYTQYTLNKGEDNPESAYGFYQIVDSTGAKKLVIYPNPTVVDLPIVIRYHRKLTPLTASNLNFEPEFDSSYHQLLAFYCCNMICSVGSSPDSYQADMFMRKYDELLMALWKDDNSKKILSQRKKSDNRHWHKSRTYGVGF